MANRSGVEYDPYTPEQSRAVKNMIERYLETEDDLEAERVLNIQSYRQMLEVCRQFKLLFKQHAITRPSTVESSASGLGAKASARLPTSDQQYLDGLANGSESAQFVGELDPRQTVFSLGIAPDDARPPFIESPKRSPHRSSAAAAIVASPMRNRQRMKDDTLRSPERKSYDEPNSFQAFEAFKLNAGKKIHDEFVAAKSELKANKLRLKQAAARVNETKEELDSLNEEVGGRLAKTPLRKVMYVLGVHGRLAGTID
jgi:hypothetical protein